MKQKIFTLITFCLFSINSFSQNAVWKVEGVDNIPNFTMKDINNNNHSLYTATQAGKHMIIDFSATWCGPCWSYHSSHVLQRYYEKYGPTGTLAQDAAVVMYEVDKTTNNLTTSSFGDWTTGVTYPICDDNVSNNPVVNFMSSGGSYGIPTVVVVCSDNTYFKISTSNTNETVLRSFIETNCGLAPMSNTSLQEVGFQYDIYPNPSNNELNIDLNLNNNQNVAYSLVNMVGQKVVDKKKENVTSGINKLQINTSSLPNGIYFLHLSVGDRNLSNKIIVQH
ncbi:MAG: T9SS type A sorting domain-containing protein [Chitinophagaceae bacterium]|nr:T9SS type A sorting domain-containing protein [Chitinophagaceae bacterium]